MVDGFKFAKWTGFGHVAKEPNGGKSVLSRTGSTPPRRWTGNGYRFNFDDGFSKCENYHNRQGKVIVMQISAVKAIVTEAATSRIVVAVVDRTFLQRIVSLGFSPVLTARLEVVSASAVAPIVKANLFASLRDEGVCFSAGPDWCPADVFEYLREQGLLSGPYRRIAWRGSDQPVVVENC